MCSNVKIFAWCDFRNLVKTKWFFADHQQFCLLQQYHLCLKLLGDSEYILFILSAIVFITRFYILVLSVTGLSCFYQRLFSYSVLDPRHLAAPHNNINGSQLR